MYIKPIIVLAALLVNPGTLMNPASNGGGGTPANALVALDGSPIVTQDAQYILIQ
jgi:hypothetical protein